MEPERARLRLILLTLSDMPEISCLSPDLVSEAICLDSCIPRGSQTAVLISLFCQMANVSCDSADLLEGARCISECIPEGMQEAVLIYLACQLVNNGGGGSGDKEIFHGTGDPTGVVVPTGTDAIYRQTDSIPAGLIWTWEDSGPWVAPAP